MRKSRKEMFRRGSTHMCRVSGGIQIPHNLNLLASKRILSTGNRKRAMQNLGQAVKIVLKFSPISISFSLSSQPHTRPRTPCPTYSQSKNFHAEKIVDTGIDAELQTEIEKDKTNQIYASICVTESDQGMRAVIGKISPSRIRGKHLFSILTMFIAVFTCLYSMDARLSIVSRMQMNSLNMSLC